jgi:hypothetical protein
MDLFVRYRFFALPNRYRNWRQKLVQFLGGFFLQRWQYVGIGIEHQASPGMLKTLLYHLGMDTLLQH